MIRTFSFRPRLVDMVDMRHELGTLAALIKFLAVDLSEANDLTVGIMALVAQQEREAISRRTKEVLVIAKAAGRAARQPERRGGAPASRAGRGAPPARSVPERRPARG